jgi:hypothetical protein
MDDSKATRKRVWVLGAGFSRPLGGPLMADLLSRTPHSFRVSDEKLGAFSAADDADVRNLFHDGRALNWWPHAESFLDTVETARFEHGKQMTETHAMKLLRDAKIKDPVALSDAVRRSIIVDCWSFLNLHDDLIKDSDRWRPFVRWAEKLSFDDTIVTFNYDAVPELLQHKAKGHISVIRPYAVQDDILAARNLKLAPVFKLHGSVTWGRRRQDGTYRADCDNSAIALDNSEFEPLIGFPGPDKKIACESQFSTLWNESRKALNIADEINFIGYGFPQTDSIARETILECLLANPKARVTAVLGANSPDAARVNSMLKRFAGSGYFVPTQSYGEEFLTAFYLTGDRTD